MADLPDWPYWKVASITGQSGAGTDYQVKFEIGDSAGGDFHLEGHCTNFPQDVRITDDDGTTLLDHWVEDLTADPIVVRVKVNDDLGSNRDIRVYYGKSGETTASHIKNTFVVGDDFIDSSIDTNLWAATGAVSEGANGLTISLNANRDVNYVCGVQTFDRTQAYISEMIYQQSNAAPSDFVGGFGTSGLFGNGLWLYTTSGTDVYRYLDGSFSSKWASSSRSANTNWKMKVLLKATQGYTLWDMYNLDANYTQREDNAAWTLSNLKVQLGNAYNASNILIKQYTLRKYNSPEPAFSSAGAEQTPTGAAPTGVFYGPLVGPFGGPI